MVREGVLALRANETGDADIVKLLEQQTAAQKGAVGFRTGCSTFTDHAPP